MIISDIDYLEDKTDISIIGGFGGFSGFIVNNDGPIGVQFNTEISQQAEGKIAKNEANLTFNVNFKDLNVG